jgi:16S rRNA (uracil1498-N3)-methyltransferase
VTVRYFVPELPLAGGQVWLPDAEAHHAATVMRAKVGERVTLFDGRGHQSSAELRSVSKRAVECVAEATLFLPRDNRCEIRIGVAMPKGDRSRELVERLTELGVDQLIPLACERSPWDLSESAVKKWGRSVIEACKQSGRNRLLTITAPTPWAQWSRETPKTPCESWLAHPGGRAIDATLTAPLRAAPSAGAESAPPPVTTSTDLAAPRPLVRIAIGPEGGFTAAEVTEAGSAGWQTVDLGDRIYRIETAAVILVALAAVAANPQLGQPVA